MALYQIKRLFHSKGNSFHTEEKVYRMGGNIFWLSSKWALKSRTYEGLKFKQENESSNL